MSDTRSIIIDTTSQSGVKKQKSFTYINPNATQTEMHNFVVAANNLTTNTMTDASVVDKTSIINTKDNLTFIKNNQPTTETTISSASFTDNGRLIDFTINNENNTPLYYNTKYDVFPLTVENTSGIYPIICYSNIAGSGSGTLLITITGKIITSNNNPYNIPGGTNLNTSKAGDIIIKTKETAKYAAQTLTIHITD